MEKLTKKQRKFIRENYKSVSVKQMSKTLGVNRDIIQEFIEQIKTSSVVSAEDVIAKKSFSVLPQQQKEVRFQFFAIVFIFLVTFIIYANSLKNEFVYDDKTYIVENYFIKNWKNLPDLFTHNYFKLSEERTYRPLCTLSFFIDYVLWKLNPTGWRITNILLHALNGILVYFIITYLLKPIANSQQHLNPPQSSLIKVARDISSQLPNYQFLALAASLLFVTQPVQTEVINCVSFREDLMALFFFLISLLLYIKPQISQISQIKTNNEQRTITCFTL